MKSRKKQVEIKLVNKEKQTYLIQCVTASLKVAVKQLSVQIVRTSTSSVRAVVITTTNFLTKQTLDQELKQLHDHLNFVRHCHVARKRVCVSVCSRL